MSQPLPLEQAVETVLAAARNSRQASAKSISISQPNDAVGSKDEYVFKPPIPQPPASKIRNTTLLRDKEKDVSDVLPGEPVPMLSQRLPNSTETLIIEKDIRRASDQDKVIPQLTSSSVPRLPEPRIQIKPRESGRLRLVLFFLAIIVAFALIASSVLILIKAVHQPTQANVSKALPAMTVTPGIAHFNQIVQVHMSNFSPSAKIRLTHDVQEGVRTDTNAPFITLSANGDGDVRIFVDESWEAGSHTIEAEDIKTHYSASTILHVMNDLSLRPPYLLISLPGMTTGLKSPLDMGSNEQGANTLQSLVLRNSGGGWISWNAISNQPWLMISPQQGIFQDGQSIEVAVTRANLKPGNYEGTITIVSNTGTPLIVQVKMDVLSISASDNAASSILLVTTPVLSFTGTDGGADPTPQMLTISNPGSQALAWFLTVSPIQDTFNQNFSSLNDVTWLGASTTSGTVPPNQSAKIQVNIYSNNLLPSVYGAILTFTSGRDTINAPQTVAVSLTIQPSCGIATNLGNLSFTSIAGQITTDNQLLSLSTTIGCPGIVNWQSFSSSSWLSITPARGQLQAKVNFIVTVQVSAGGLQPGTYTGSILFVSQQHAQTVLVQLMVKSSSTPTGSSSNAVLEISSQNFQFTVNQGQGNPAGKSFLMSNTGEGSLFWQANIDSSVASWLSLNPVRGTINSAQSIQEVVNVNSADLPPGNYSTQITLNATDNAGNQAQGSPQTIQVMLNVLPACLFQVTPVSLSFTATFSQPNPPGQDIVLTIVGSCPRLVSWIASVNNGSQKWLIPSATSGTVSNQGSVIIVDVRSKGLGPGVYTGQIVISTAVQSGGVVQNSPLDVPVTLTVNF